MKNDGSSLMIIFVSILFVAIAGMVTGVVNAYEPAINLQEKEESFRNPADFEPSPKPVIVAVIDTGFDFQSDWSEIIKKNPKLRKPRTCKYGNVDFTQTNLQDNHGHGTHIAGLIAQYADKENYCLVIMKYFNKTEEKIDHLVETSKAFQRAIDLKVDIINYSGGGEEKSLTECVLIKKALDAGIVVVAAAGNEYKNINDTPYYPAMCDDRVKAVSNINTNGDLVKSSNFSDNAPKSRHLYTQIGINVVSLAPKNQTSLMTGTSQAAAIQTGKIIKDWHKH